MLATLRSQLDNKEISSVELTTQYLERIKQHNQLLNAYILTLEEYALEQAAVADKQIATGTVTPFTGIPYGLKDLFCVEGIETTACSNILKGYVPPYTGTAVQRLAGGVLLGKLNTDEFAMGASSESSCFGVTKNPYDTSRVAGGSSGGPAAAVAANLAAFSLGTDTGGSIRLPASFCGLAGLRPTYGRVSRYGVIAMASSLDTIGPLAQSVDDIAYIMQAIAGHDPLDSTTPNVPVDEYTELLNQPLGKMTVGLPKEYFEMEGLDNAIRQRIMEVVEQLKANGVVIKEVSLPHTQYAVPTYYIIVPSEVSSNMAKYDGIKYGFRSDINVDLDSIYAHSRAEGFGPEVRRRIMLGTYALSSGYYDAYYLKAMKVRTLIRQDFDAVFKEVDALITPITATLPFKIGENVDDPLKMYSQDIFTAPASLAGVPGLSVPVGAIDALPVGMQIIGPQWSEGRLLQFGKMVENFYEPLQPTL